MKKKILSILFFAFAIITFHSQTVTKYSSGEIYWGSFNVEKQEIEGKLEQYSTVTYLEKASDSVRTYYYKIVGLEKSGKKFNINLYGKVNENYNFLDETGLEFMVIEKDNSINILCLKPLPTDEKNLFLYLSLKNFK